MHAWELPDPYLDRIEARSHADEWHELGQQMLDEALGDWRDRHPHVSIETRVVHGHAASVLVAAAEAADLLVVRRAHEHRPFDHLGAHGAGRPAGQSRAGPGRACTRRRVSTS